MKYKYRIIKRIYKSGKAVFEAQKKESGFWNSFLKYSNPWNPLVMPGYNETFETTKEKAEETLEWHKNKDEVNYKRWTVDKEFKV